MLRLVFLLLVVLGALAVTLGLIFGIGIARRASTVQNEPAVAAASSAPPATQGAAATSPSQPSAPATQAAAPVVSPPPPAVPDGAIVVSLSPAQAELTGDEIQIERDPLPTIGAWRRVQEYVLWHANVPAKGFYRIDMLYACEEGSGGEFVLKAGANKFVSETHGTGGWDKFKWVTLGTAKINSSVTLAIKPTELLPGHSLMRLREVRLVLVSEPKMKK